MVAGCVARAGVYGKVRVPLMDTILLPWDTRMQPEDAMQERNGISKFDVAEGGSMSCGAMDGTGAFCSYVRCSSQNVTKVLDIVRGIFDSLAKDGVTEDELRKAKNKILSALVIKNELPMGRLVDLGFNWIYLNEYRNIQDDVNAIKAVTVDDVHSVIEQFDPGDFTQLSIGPGQKS